MEKKWVKTVVKLNFQSAIEHGRLQFLHDVKLYFIVVAVA